MEATLRTTLIDPRPWLLDKTMFTLAANGVRISTVRTDKDGQRRTFATVLQPDDALRLADAIHKRYRP